MGSLVQIRPVNNRSFEIRNNAPVNLTNVAILAKIEGVNEWVRLYTLTELGGLRSKTLPYPFVKGTTVLPTADGRGTVDLSGLAAGISAEAIAFDYAGDSKIVKKLKSLSRIEWDIKYHNYGAFTDNPNWDKNVKPIMFRHMSVQLINLAYVFNSDAFAREFIAAPNLDNSRKPLTKEQKKEIVVRLRNRSQLNVGLTAGKAAGLGGGSVFGTYGITAKQAISSSNYNIAVHEFGHILGFSHNSSMTYGKTVNGEWIGFVSVANKVLSKMRENGELPITLDNYFQRSDYPADW